MTDTKEGRLAAIVGSNLKRIRSSHGLSQQELVQHLAGCSLDWSQTKIAALETGRRQLIDLQTLLELALALQQPLEEWLLGATVGTVLKKELPGGPALSDDLTEALDQLDVGSPTMLAQIRPSGEPGEWEWVDSGERFSINDFQEPIDADRRLAARLGVETDYVLKQARAIWGWSLTSERDRLARARVEAGEEWGSAKRAEGKNLSRHMTGWILEDFWSSLEGLDLSAPETPRVLRTAPEWRLLRSVRFVMHDEDWNGLAFELREKWVRAVELSNQPPRDSDFSSSEHPDDSVG